LFGHLRPQECPAELRLQRLIPLGQPIDRDVAAVDDIHRYSVPIQQ
jgi:hypothetical protein